MPVVALGKAEMDPASGEPVPATGRYLARHLARTGGLSQFGVVHETLSPGARSSIFHWHAEEDEFVYMLDGEVVLIEGNDETRLTEGTSACFRAGIAIGHCLENRSDREAAYLVVGTRAVQDCITYPDHDRVLTVNRETGTSVWTTHDGAPADDPYDRSET